MLAIEVILASSGRTMVFDGVDAGRQGAVEIAAVCRAPEKPGDRGDALPRSLLSDAHIYVIRPPAHDCLPERACILSEEERRRSRRMLAGLESDTGRAHAEELMAMAVEAKKH